MATVEEERDTARVMQPDPVLAELAAIDRRLVAAVRGIRLLSAVSWPATLQTEFIERYRRNKTRLPEVVYPTFEFDAVRAEIDAIQAACKTYGDHPVADYIWRTAESFEVATHLLDNLGKPEMTQHSIRLFGKPGDMLPGAELHNIDAARHFIFLA